MWGEIIRRGIAKCLLYPTRPEETVQFSSNQLESPITMNSEFMYY